MKTVWRLVQSIVVLTCLTNTAFAEVLRCDVSAKFACAPSGCEPNKLGVHNIVDLEAKKFARCDSKSCDSYDAVIQRSGEYITVDVPGRGMFAKLSSDGSQFVEVVSMARECLLVLALVASNEENQDAFRAIWPSRNEKVDSSLLRRLANPYPSIS